jgi:CRISPR-associated protein Cas2
MNLEIEIIICYDIEDNKKRQKLYNLLKRFGLFPIQKSVFWGYILPMEKQAILREIEKYVSEGDKVFLVQANLSNVIKDQSFGYNDPEFFKNKEYIIT